MVRSQPISGCSLKNSDTWSGQLVPGSAAVRHLGQILVGREVFRYTLDQFGHEEEAVAITRKELLEVLLKNAR